MAMARVCDRCGATFGLNKLFRNRVAVFYYNPEGGDLRSCKEEIADRVDMELCHNCIIELQDFLGVK